MNQYCQNHVQDMFTLCQAMTIINRRFIDFKAHPAKTHLRFLKALKSICVSDCMHSTQTDTFHHLPS